MTRQDIPKSAAKPESPDFYAEHNIARHETVRADVARRLRKACGHLSDEAFALLVAKIVEVQLKSERGQTKTLS